MTKLPLPLNEVVDMSTCSNPDYCDGDCSGYHGATFDHGVLTLSYDADDFSTSASARAQFVEIGALVSALTRIIPNADDEDDWRQMLSDALGVAITETTAS